MRNFKLLSNEPDIRIISRGHLKIKLTLHSVVEDGIDTEFILIWDDGDTIEESDVVKFRRKDNDIDSYEFFMRTLLCTCENMVVEHDYDITQCFEICRDSFTEAFDSVFYL